MSLPHDFDPSEHDDDLTTHSGVQLRAVVFDLDNTLFDFISMKEKAVEAAAWAMIDAGLPLTPEEVNRRIFQVYELEGIEFQHVFDHMLGDVLGKVDPKILAAGIVAYRRVREAMLVPFPHTRSTLVDLVKQGIKIAVVSDAPSVQAWLRLCYLQLQDLFDTVVTFDDTGQTKPSPEPYRLALSRLRLQPEEALMVGDWIDRDLLGAKRIGMRTAHAHYGAELPEEAPAPLADAILKDIRDILTLVDKWK
ncbi:HAD-IA family hydrolase [bacterium]|nr:HAD-IA family hydrolase [bacterium]